MSKRFTSLLFGALAVVLLAAPAQAQDVTKKAGFQKEPKASYVLKRQNTEVSKESKSAVEAQRKAEEATRAEERQNVDAQQGLQFVSRGSAYLNRIFANTREVAPVKQNVPYYAAAPTTDANGIITSPDAGEHKFYTRSGVALYPSGQQVYMADQSGEVEIVEAADGVVYIKDLITRYTQNTWVKGTKNGNTITVPVGQPVAYNTQYATTLSIYWSDYDENSQYGWNKQATENIEFTIDGDVISLQGSSENMLIAVFWDDDDSFSGYGDWETVWTYDPDFVPVSTDPIVLPAGVTAEDWYATGSYGTSTGTTPFAVNAKVAFDGSDVYLSGIFQNYPNSWIKGTISGSTVTFSGLQFLGNYSSNNIFAVGTDGEGLTDFTMSYDAENGMLVADNYLLANAAEDRIYYLEWLMDLVVSKEQGSAPEEPTIVVGDNVDVLPYANGFDTEEELAAFGIYDANNDKSTWSPNSGSYRYMYNSSNDANDWLMSPGIFLEAGKNYIFSLDIWAASTSYPERIEVLMGTEPKASSLTQTIIPATDVTWTAPQTFEVAFKAEETGYYNFGIHAISYADEYALSVDNFSVEAGAEPTAPAAITDLTVANTPDDELAAIITFTAPTTSVDGNALTENLTKIDLFRDGVIIKTYENVAPGTVITFIDNAETGMTAGPHKYMVIPYNASGVGVKSEVVEEVIVVPYNVPATLDLTNETIFSLFTVINNNFDNSTWTFSSGAAAYSYNSSNNADDYLVSPVFKLKAGKNYNVVVNARAASTNYPERFEVLVGKQATTSALNITAIKPVDVLSNEFDDFEGEFTVPEDGEYYVAVHAISDADMSTLYVASLTVEAGLEPTSPLAPRLAVQPDPFGYEKAVVTVTAPARSYDGNKLTSNLSKLVVYRDGEAIKTFEDVAPQATKVFVDENVSGAHVYQAYPFDQNGNPGQKSAKVKTAIGLDKPVYPIATAVEGVNTVKLSWDTPTEGANGGIVVPEGMTYNIYSTYYEQGWFGPQLVVGDLITSTTENSIELPLDLTKAQEYTILAISAVNEAGEGTLGTVGYFDGNPYAMPLTENFGSQGWTLGTWTIDDYSGDADYDNSADASDEDGGAIVLLGTNGKFFFTPGKIAMREGGNPTLLVDVKGTSKSSKFKVYVDTADGQRHLVSAVVPTEDYKTLKVSLAQFAAEPFVKVIIGGEFAGQGEIVIDNLKVTDLLEHNLTATINAPKTVQAGNTANVLVTVKNQGENIAKDYTVKVTADDQVLYNEKIAEALSSFAVKEIAVDFATTIFDDPADVTLTAEVEYDVDLDLDDNIAETVITVKQSTAAVPENVTGEKTANGVKLSWNAPSSSVEEVTEDFENQEVFPAWDLGGITRENHTGAFGAWTLYDGNGIGVYGFESFEFPNAYQPQAWQVANPAELSADFAASYAPASGDQFLWSFCPADEVDGQAVYPAADHWLISPELPGIAQTISFLYRVITDQYGAETFEVLYSTTDNNPASFQKVADKAVTDVEWTECSVELPAGAKYFAIRHTAKDIFGLLIDDVTYTRGGGSIASYNVWVDGELAESTTATSIELEGASTSSVFAVSAVYANGAESRPVVFVFNEADKMLTGIKAITGNNSPVDIYTLDGKLVRSQATDLNGLKGAYIIEGQKVILK